MLSIQLGADPILHVGVEAVVDVDDPFFLFTLVRVSADWGRFVHVHGYLHAHAENRELHRIPIGAARRHGAARDRWGVRAPLRRGRCVCALLRSERTGHR